MEHIISTKQFLDRNALERLFNLANEMEKLDKSGRLKDSLRGKILATVFYEPSTRTRFSFESAMLKLGGNVVSTENASQFSSVTKGETLQDTIKIISGYSDIIVLRHDKEGSAEIAANCSDVPVINAGDGIGEHPTQALLDIFTIKKEFEDIDNLNIALVGDLLYGRTIHSLIYLLGLYDNLKLYLISPKELKLPEKYKDYLKENNIEFEEFLKIDGVLNGLDLIYVTRIQKERFEKRKNYEKVKDSYIFDKAVLSKLKKNSRIMHPLPRVNEISPEIDEDEKAAYFRQAKNGVYVRMALLDMLLNGGFK